jgi:hypothetical protein
MSSDTDGRSKALVGGLANDEAPEFRRLRCCEASLARLLVLMKECQQSVGGKQARWKSLTRAAACLVQPCHRLL